MIKFKRITCYSAAVCLAVFVCPIGGLAQAKSFTLEQVLSAPFPDDLTAAPAGGKVAWVFNSQGARNVWVAEPAANSGHFKSRSLTTYSDDDGQEIAELSWLPDASAIVYARGGDFENGGKYPNPASDPSGVDQGIWIVSLSGGPPRRLAEGHSPTVSPQGDSVAYVYKDQVWLVKISGAEKAAQLIHSKGKVNSLRWSPDGSKLAYASPRGDHGFVGVYNFKSRSLLYLDPSVDRDIQPAWSPDGGQIAFIRLPANREAFMFGPKRTAQPWSIRIADASTGAGREVWKADEGRGSAFRAVPADNEILWGAGERLVFPWERDGWTHLYSVSTHGGRAELLTPGEFEVEHTSLSPDRSQVLFASNQNDIDRRHIWKVGVAGGSPIELTNGTGIEWAPVMTSDDKAIAVLRSDARRPARPGIVMGSGKLEDLAPEAIPADFPAASLVEPQQVIISASDGMRIHGQLFLPSGAREGERRPAVIFFHGGSRREMLLGWHYMLYYHNAYGLNQYLANHGYVVLSVNYRSGIGYGMEFREALNYGATGASEFNDVMGAGLYLRSRPDVDPARIGLWGGSYGGYLTALGLARASNLFAAGVDMHGVHDWNIVIHHFVPAYDPEAHPDAARLAFESSPLAAVKTWRSPVLLIQGDDDRNVPFSETVHLAEALRKQGVTFEQLVFPDEIHEFLMHKTWLAAYHAAADFLNRRLASQP
ncbi:MAG TPA: prolyl oligopeptidase family serine peptidase [Terriglobia bacterium]|nr:prolyl oligopeptidase family serine peptidase [Terriglobia bacterium]